MDLGPEVYGLTLLATVVPALGLAWIVWGKRDKPGGRWLLFMIVGMTGWSVCWGLMLVFDRRDLSLASLNLLLAFVSLASIGWVLMTLEFTQQRRYSPRYVLALSVVPVLTQAVAWTNPSHFLMWGPGTTIDATGVVQAQRGTAFAFHAGYNYLIMLFSGALLVNRLFTFEGIYRKQTAVMFVAWSLTIVTSVAFSFSSLPFRYLNPTPLGFLVGGVVWTWGLYRFRLFEIIPVARRRAFDEMDEAVVAIDEDGVVVDVNNAATKLFSLDGRPTGEHLASVLARFPSVINYLQNDEKESSVIVDIGGDPRHLTATKAAVDRDGRHTGYVAVFKDVTRLKSHERDLELLKQVFARVFRHDLSNDLNVIRAYGELLASQQEGEEAAYARKIVETCDDVIDTSRQARAIEKLVDADRERYEVDLVHVVEETVSWARNRYPEADIEVDLPPKASVLADGDIRLAVQALVDNAVVHNEATDPWVRVSIEEREGLTVFAVEDDGPGIDEEERTVFSERQVEPLSHSSGLGLWTVDWVVRNSRGGVRVNVTESGTTVVLTLEPCLGPDTERTAARHSERNPQP